MQSSNLTRAQRKKSGSSDLPALLAYPQFLGFNPKSIKDKYCYIIDHYGRDGIAVMIKYEDENFAVRCGDWNGNLVDINSQDRVANICKMFIEEDIKKFFKAMRLMRFTQAQYYFAISESGLRLVDIQLSMNKFASPGMVKDIFGNLYPTQNVRGIEVINDRILEIIENNTGKCEGDFILKPSAVAFHHLPNNAGVVPFYMQMKRDA